ncbi:acyl-coenzyme A--6-aminopenicillanic-acid-acyltransferase form [Micromonospora arborensis]|uniref:Acyl-coenzyme A--6-aminopenicillanic-acid-acyltransferase form n=1 Tax=Micromonospora arborensis TaxID=2116518 RepID=A0A318NSU0_9ACTN|nr:C45 family peptidase [Micromonospora arborensis]PYC74968.1 acyl-coenzyme A--6-aminopenicillanic-acid-acyltransferase form [Micromonospora arborensis]
MASLRTIEISGTSALDRGTQYGRAAADLIADAIAYYARAFEHQCGLTWAEVLDRARPWQRLIADGFPELHEEMAGIADGAGVSLTEIVTLNCRGEIIYDRDFGPARPADETEGCTSFSLTGAAAGDSHVYCGQNWDWRHQTASTLMILRIVQPPKPTLIMQVEAGQIGRHGANSEGLAFNANGLGGRFDTSVGVPQTLIRRLVLDSSSVSDALRILVETKAHIASNALLTHRSGYSIDLETTPGPIGWEYPSEGLLVHGNHYQAFVPPQLAATHRPTAPDSLLRVPRARQGLAAAAVAEKPVDVRSAVHAAMSDHLGYPDSLCAHPDERLPEVRRWSTLLSSCVDLTTGEYYVAAGTPCTNPYELLPFNLYE